MKGNPAKASMRLLIMALSSPGAHPDALVWERKRVRRALLLRLDACGACQCAQFFQFALDEGAVFSRTPGRRCSAQFLKPRAGFWFCQYALSFARKAR
jgi:hypothetical protein